MRVHGPVLQRIAHRDAFAILRVDVDAAGNRVFLHRTVVGGDGDLAKAFGDLAVFDDAADFGDHGRVTRFARFEQFNDAGQTTGDVLGLRGCARDLSQHIAGMDGLFMTHHQVSMGRHEITFLIGLATAHRANDHDRDLLLVGRVNHHRLRKAGDFVDLLLDGDAIHHVLEVNHTRNFRQNREGVGIPFEEFLILAHGSAVIDQDARAVHHGVTLFFAALVVQHRHDAGARHRDDFALGIADGSDTEILHRAIGFGVLLRLFRRAGGRSTDVEGTHGELSAGFADGLGGDDAHRFAAFHHPARGQVAAVAELANTATGFASENRADLDALNTGRLDSGGFVFVNLFVGADNDFAFEVALIFERHAADDAVTQGLDDFARFDDRLDMDTVAGAAVEFGDNDVLRHVAQAAGEVAGVSGFKRRIRQTFTRTVRRDEVLQHVQAFTEISRDGRFDNLAGRLGHQAAHPGKLTNLLLGTASA